MFVLKPEHAEAHRNGDIHIHDMDFLTLTTTCYPDRPDQAVPRRILHRPRLFAGAQAISQSYAALACIAIQANQNDQHGGQSIVNFDYAMAEGVKKTFRQAVSGQPGHGRWSCCAAWKTAKERYVPPVQGNGQSGTCIPRWCSNEPYPSRGGSRAPGPAWGWTSLPSPACRPLRTNKAVEETDRATYQAMEALIHNLNTMNSRAGAQVPFSSINYGMDTSPEGPDGDEQPAFWPPRRAWATARLPSSPSRFSG